MIDIQVFKVCEQLSHEKYLISVTEASVKFVSIAVMIVIEKLNGIYSVKIKNSYV